LLHADVDRVLCVCQDESGVPSAVELQQFRLECDDEDETDTSWLALLQILSDFTAVLARAIDDGGNVLVCDPTGFSTSAALVSAFLLLKYQLRVSESEELCVQARPSVYMSVSHKKGLRSMQDRLDKLKLTRLDCRLRTSPIVSIAF
jgi:protein-tyrosine phosphatase